MILDLNPNICIIKKKYNIQYSRTIIIFIQFVWKQVIIHSLVSVMMYPSI